MDSKIDFEKLYQDNYQAVYYTALSLMGEKYAAEDITQEVFITAFTKYGDLKDLNSFSAWVKRIAANKCIDELRKKRPISTEDIETEYAGELEPEENFLQEDYVLNEEKRKTVINIMKNVLSEKQFETVFLYYYDELSMTEISNMLDIPEGTVLSRLSTSRAKIKQGVLEHEKKHNEKLYSIGILPLLAMLFKEEAAAVNIPDAIPATLQGAVQAGAKVAGENIAKQAVADKVLAGKAVAGKTATGMAIKIGAIGAAATGTVLVAATLLIGGIWLNHKMDHNVTTESEIQQTAETTVEPIQGTTVPSQDTVDATNEHEEKGPGELLKGISVSLDHYNIALGKTTVREILENPQTYWEDDIWYREILTLAPNTEGTFELKNLYWRSVAEGKDFSKMTQEEKEELESNGEEFLLYTCNLTNQEIDERDGVIIGISLKAPECDFSLAPPLDVNGLHFGSSLEEVKAVFGDPIIVHEDEREWDWYTDNNEYIDIWFTEDGKMNKIIYYYEYEEKEE